MHVGLVIDAHRLVRASASVDATAFAANVNASLFFATFAALAPAADGVSPTEREQHAEYSLMPGVRVTTTTTTPETTTTRRHRVRVCREAAFSMRPRWFDVQLLYRQETPTSEPAALREARAIAARVRDPLRNERTRASFPTSTRTIERRYLDFADTPTWRLAFSTSTFSRLARTDDGEYTYTTRRSGMLLSTGHAETYSLVLECAARDDDPTARVVDDALRLLERVATALGATMGEIRQRIDDDWEAYERAHI